MQEKRRSKRIQVHLNLKISELFKQNNECVGNIDAPIEVIDISRTGIGFNTRSNLPIGYYFNAKIQLGSENSFLYTVVKIVRMQELDNGDFNYGCELVGLSPVFSYIFDELEEINY